MPMNICIDPVNKLESNFFLPLQNNYCSLRSGPVPHVKRRNYLILFSLCVITQNSVSFSVLTTEKGNHCVLAAMCHTNG